MSQLNNPVDFLDEEQLANVIQNIPPEQNLDEFPKPQAPKKSRGKTDDVLKKLTNGSKGKGSKLLNNPKKKKESEKKSKDNTVKKVIEKKSPKKKVKKDVEQPSEKVGKVR